MSSLQFQVGRFNPGSIWHLTPNYVLTTGLSTFSVKSSSAELICLGAGCGERACRNHTKDRVGHFPRGEKAMQARLGELRVRRTPRVYRAKG